MRSYDLAGLRDEEPHIAVGLVFTTAGVTECR
jgi:hypothetical protein